MSRLTDYKTNLISLIWACSEATFFFIMPDVWLSFTALEDLKRGLKNVAFAIIGALIGGSVMYFFGTYDAEQASWFLQSILKIKEETMGYVYQIILSDGFMAIFYGPLKGIPYKIYAVTVGALSMNYVVFALISIPARAIRFIITILISRFMSKFFMKKMKLRSKHIILVCIWVAIYTLFFTMKS